MKDKIKDKLFKDLRHLLDTAAKFSGITVSDEAIKKALDGNVAMCEALLSIINERIQWWLMCDFNKALFAKQTYEILENYYDEMEITENE